MTNILHAIVLGIVQGVTEFLPVSSSAHLILFPKLLGWPDQGLAFDVAVHLGTLLSVIYYFRHDLKLMCHDWWRSITQRKNTPNSRLAWAIGFGTIPVGLAGLVLHDFIAHNMRATWIIAATTIGFGLILGFANAIGKQKRDEHKLTWQDVLIIGCAQAIALIPGVSRSGITLTAGLFVGLKRGAAARFSFLLSIPVILLAGAVEIQQIMSHHTKVDYPSLAIGFLVAAVSGYLCIKYFLQLLERFGVMPFVYYRLALGIFLLYVLV